MDLILWRHAQAKELCAGSDDVSRALTTHGHKQALRVAQWLDHHLPQDTRVLCSPALRAEQTAKALDRKFKLRDELAPGATPQQLLELVQWPDAKPTFLVVGHQPALGQTVAHLLGIATGECAIKKAGIWWLRHDGRASGGTPIRVMAVLDPQML